MTTRTATVRFLTTVEASDLARFEGGDDRVMRGVAHRVEGERYCPRCKRTHVYSLGWAPAGETGNTICRLYDRPEEAASQIKEWFGDEGPVYRGRREPYRSEEGETFAFTNLPDAIAWLLEPVP
jgi:hypothetical protein